MRKKLVLILFVTAMNLQLFGSAFFTDIACAAETESPSEDYSAGMETEDPGDDESEMPDLSSEETQLPPEEEDGMVSNGSEREGFLGKAVQNPAADDETEETEQTVMDSETIETEETEENVLRSERVIADGYYYIRCAKDVNFGLDIKGGQTISGANAQIYAHNGTRAQIFHIVYDEKSRLYSILNEKSGLALTQEAGTYNVCQETVVKEQKSQQWVICKNENGSFSLINAGSKLFMQAEKGGNTAGNASLTEMPEIEKQSFLFDSILAISSAEISVEDQEYNAMKKTPDPKVVLCGKTLEKEKDYVLSYQNNVNPGEASVILNGIGNYKWSAAKTFRIKCSQVIEDGLYYIANASNPDYVLDITAGSVNSGANIQLYKSNQTPAQMFYIEWKGSSGYKITNIKSMMAIDVSGGSVNDAANIQQYLSNDTDAQRWYVYRNTDGSYSIANRKSLKNIDIAGGRIANKTNIQQYHANQTKAQKFKFIRVPASAQGMISISNAEISVGTQTFCAKALTPDPKVVFCGRTLTKGKDYSLSYKNNLHPGTASVTVTGKGIYKGSVTKNFRITCPRTVKNGIYYIASASDMEYVLDVTGGSLASKANIQLYQCNHTPAQMFLVEWKGNGEYIITNLRSKMPLDVTGGSVQDHANIQQYPSNDTDAQRWRIFVNPDGSYSLANKKSAKTIDITDSKISSRTNIQQFHFHDAKAQKFQFIEVAESELISKADQIFDAPVVRAEKYMPYVEVKWDYVLGVQHYRVFKKDAAGKWKPITDTTENYYIDKTVKTGEKYYYTVRCITPDGEYLSGFQSPGAVYVMPDHIPASGNEIREIIAANAASYNGMKGQSLKHRHIIDIFNELQPDGYPMYYYSPWCAAFASAVSMEILGNDCANHFLPLSYNCETIIRRSRSMGIWIERDNYIPKQGDWIIYDWKDDGKGEDIIGYDHVGIVTSVSGNTFTVIEGNNRDTCAYRNVKVNSRYIRGFVSPDYEAILSE